MGQFADYYENFKQTVCNAKEIDISLADSSLFPETLYLGDLKSPQGMMAPALLPMKEVKGLCFLSKSNNVQQVRNCIQNTVLRLLLSLPPGLCKLTLYDGLHLGANLIYLSNLSTKIIGEKILTSPDELKRALVSLNNDISHIVQKVLGVKFAGKSLIDYNENVGELAHPYHFLIISDYPNSLDKEICDLIERIIKIGRQAGIFVIMNIDTDYEPSSSFGYNPTIIVKEMTAVYQSPDSNRWYIKNFPYEEWFNDKFFFKLTNYSLSSHSLENVVNHINQQLVTSPRNSSIDISNELTNDNMWTLDSSKGVKIPIGKVNSTNIQYFILSLNEGDSDAPHHCLIGGATGSGKTVLLHNIICNGAWLYRPDNLQFILLDYKEGTEFKIYENLPHVKVLSMRSEVEYGLSVFRYLYQEIERRGDLFKQLDVSNIQKYNSKAAKKLPRILVIIDEFQKLLDGNASSSSFVSSALDDIGRRGRSFGINLILSTQSLSGVNINQALSHLGLRICLKLNSAKDCDQLLGPGNHVPFTTITKIGEGIYNSRSGLVEGNQLFQGSYINDDHLIDMIANIKDSVVNYYKTAEPFKRYIYDGEIASSISDNPVLKKGCLPVNERFCDIYVGEPCALQESQTRFRLSRQNGANVIIIGNDLAAATSLCYHSVSQIMAQSDMTCECYVCDKTNIDSDYYGCLKELTNHPNTFFCEDDVAVEQVITQISESLDRRKKGEEERTRTLLVISDLYNVRSMRKSGYTVAKATQQLQTILRDGPSFGIHTLIYCKSYVNFSNVLDPLQSMQDFDIRIELFGGEGYKLFGAANIEAQKFSPKKKNIAVIQSSEDSDLQKFKVYLLK